MSNIGPQPTVEYWKLQKELCADFWYFYTWFMFYPRKRYYTREEFEDVISQIGGEGPMQLKYRRHVYFNNPN